MPEAGTKKKRRPEGKLGEHTYLRETEKWQCAHGGFKNVNCFKTSIPLRASRKKGGDLKMVGRQLPWRGVLVKRVWFGRRIDQGDEKGIEKLLCIGDPSPNTISHKKQHGVGGILSLKARAKKGSEVLLHSEGLKTEREIRMT